MVQESRIIIDGFDEDGGWDPTISIHNDSIMIEFPEFPPQKIAEQGLENSYDEHLTRELGVQVNWEDREVFVIEDAANVEEMFNKVVAFFQGQAEESMEESLDEHDTV